MLRNIKAMTAEFVALQMTLTFLKALTNFDVDKLPEVSFGRFSVSSKLKRNYQMI